MMQDDELLELEKGLGGDEPPADEPVEAAEPAEGEEQIEVADEGAETPAPPPPPQPDQHIPYSRFSQVLDEKNRATEQLARLQGAIEEARRRQAEQQAQRQPEKQPVLDPHHPDFKVEEAFNWQNQQIQRLGEALRAKAQHDQMTAAQQQQAAEIQRVTSMIDADFDRFSEANPGFRDRVRGYINDQANRLAHVEGYDPAVARQMVQANLYRAVAQRGPDIFKQWHQQFAGFAPGNPPEQQTAAGGAPAAQASSPSAPPAAPRMTSLSEAQTSGRNGKAPTLDQIMDADPEELMKYDLDSIDRAMAKAMGATTTH